MPFRTIILLILTALALIALVACSGGAGTGGDAVTDFANELSLSGYSIHHSEGHTQIELKWTASRKPLADYDVFVHALDSSGAIAFQFDHPLKNSGGLRAGSWSAGDAVKDLFLAAPPAGRAPGTYTLRIGLYVAKPMKVLTVTHASLPRPKDDWSERSVLIEHVECK